MSRTLKRFNTKEDLFSSKSIIDSCLKSKDIEIDNSSIDIFYNIANKRCSISVYLDSSDIIGIICDGGYSLELQGRDACQSWLGDNYLRFKQYIFSLLN